MSTTYISDNVCRVRKPHYCRVCGEKIKKDESCHANRFVEDGVGFYTLYFHHKCWGYSKDWDYDDWEMCAPGDVTRKEVERYVHD